MSPHSFTCPALGNHTAPTANGQTGRPATRLAEDETLYHRLLELGFAMSLRLVLARDLSGADIAKAFDQALRPRLERRQGAAGAHDSTALQRIRGYFAMDRLGKGAEILFCYRPTERLTVPVAGNRASTAPFEDAVRGARGAGQLLPQLLLDLPRLTPRIVDPAASNPLRSRRQRRHRFPPGLSEPRGALCVGQMAHDVCRSGGGWRGIAVRGVRYPPNVRGLKSSWFVMLALLPVALMTYSPWRSAYTSAASSAFRYATAP